MKKGKLDPAAVLYAKAAAEEAARPAEAKLPNSAGTFQTKASSRQAYKDGLAEP